MIIRKYDKSDCGQIVKLFYNTVHTVCRNDYTEAQLNAWAQNVPDENIWNEAFSQSFTLVAEMNGVIAGFGNLDADYLDRLYVHKDYQRLGVGAQIVAALEAQARLNGASAIYTHASITALPFFQRLGYITEKQQAVVRNNVSLTNYVLRKAL